jgi:N-acetylneuraminic acid mutarotase
MDNSKRTWKLTVVFPLLFVLLMAPSCGDDNDDEDLVGNWVSRYDFEGVARSHGITFTIGDKAYVVSGYDGDSRVRLQDCWEFDPVKNQWIKKASFPGVGRTSAVGFAVNGRGYVATGYDGTNKLKDLWEYDPESDQWAQKNSFEERPGMAQWVSQWAVRATSWAGSMVTT